MSSMNNKINPVCEPAKEFSIDERNAHKARFEFEKSPMPPLPAPAELPILPPPPLTSVAPIQPPAQGLSPSQLALLPRVSLRGSDLSDDEFEERQAWFNEVFAPHVEEFPHLKNHLVRSHAGGGTPENPLALDWSNARIMDSRVVREHAITFLMNRCEEKKINLEQAIRRMACFAIYHKEQAPQQFRMHQDIFRSYVNVAWTWSNWLTSLREE